MTKFLNTMNKFESSEHCLKFNAKMKSEIYIKEEIIESCNEDPHNKNILNYDEQFSGHGQNSSDPLNPFSSVFIKSEDEVTQIKTEIFEENFESDVDKVKTEDFHEQFVGNFPESTQNVNDESKENSVYKIDLMNKDFTEEPERNFEISSTSLDSLKVENLSQSNTDVGCENENDFIKPSCSHLGTIENLLQSNTDVGCENESDYIKPSCSQLGSHVEKKFACSLCKYETDLKKHFNRHSLIHSRTKLFKCTECDYESNYKASLKRHSLTHSDTKVLQCSECDYKCNFKHQLKVHILNHSNENRFICPVCDYKCNWKRNFENHLLTHTNTKLLNCTECDYQCNRKDQLKIHLLNHSNTKLLKCSACDYKCNYRSHLKRHSLIHMKSTS